MVIHAGNLLRDGIWGSLLAKTLFFQILSGNYRSAKCTNPVCLAHLPELLAIGVEEAS